MDTPRPHQIDLSRWTSVLLRSAHLLCVVWLGAALSGAPMDRAAAAAGVFGSGALLAAVDFAAGRIRLGELAGLVVALKLAAMGWMAWQPAHASTVFWVLVGVSALSSHATKATRHWPRRPKGAVD